MNQPGYMVAVAVAGLCFLGVLVIAVVALVLGRGMSAEAHVRLGDAPETRVGVNVPPTLHSSSHSPERQDQAGIIVRPGGTALPQGRQSD
jgi:hypothetical protein